MASVKQTAIWNMVKAREQEGGKKYDAQILARAKESRQASRAGKRRPGTVVHSSTFPRRQQPKRLPALSNTRPLGVHFTCSHLTPRGVKCIDQDAAIEPDDESIERMVAEKSRQRAGKLEELTDNSYPSHNPSAGTPIFAGQKYLNDHRQKPQIVQARIKYLQQETIRYLPSYCSPTAIGKSLEKLNIDDKLVEKCGFHQKRVQCLYSEFLSFLGPQRGINKKKEPKLSVKGLIKLLEARNIMLPPALMHRALEAMRKPGEGTEINMRAFLKIMGIFEGSARKLAAKTFFKMCDPLRQRRLNPMELLRLITEGLPKSQRPLVGAILGELLEQLQVHRPEELQYDQFVNAVANDDSNYELFQALNPFARFFAARHGKTVESSQEQMVRTLSGLSRV